jgi:hypothetical protein
VIHPQKALKMIAKGDPNNPRPQPEMKKAYDALKLDIEKTHQDPKKLLGKLMKKYGFVYTGPPEEAFGPNLGRFFHYFAIASKDMLSIDEQIIDPVSDIVGTEELYYLLHQYEQMEIATFGTHFKDNFKMEIIWQKSEIQRIEKIDIFIDALLMSQLGIRKHASMQYSGTNLVHDGERYIKVARSILGNG